MKALTETGRFNDNGSGESDEGFINRVTASAAPNGIRGLLGKRSIGSRVRDAGRSFGYSMQRQIKDGARTLPKKLGRKVRRIGVGAAGAIPLGMLALGAGAATGDPAKATALAMAAGSSGYNFTNFYGDKVAKSIGTGMNSARTSFWGTELKAREQYKFDEQFKKSPELRDALMKVYNDRSVVDEKIKSGAIQAFLNDGETDPGRIAKAMYLMDKRYKVAKDKGGYGLSDRQALERTLVTARMTRNFSPNAWISGTRENEVFRRTMYNQLHNDTNLSQKEIDDEIDRILADQDTMNS